MIWKLQDPGDPFVARRYTVKKVDSRSNFDWLKKIKTRLEMLCYGYGKQL